MWSLPFHQRILLIINHNPLFTRLPQVVTTTLRLPAPNARMEEVAGPSLLEVQARTARHPTTTTRDLVPTKMPLPKKNRPLCSLMRPWNSDTTLNNPNDSMDCPNSTITTVIISNDPQQPPRPMVRRHPSWQPTTTTTTRVLPFHDSRMPVTEIPPLVAASASRMPRSKNGPSALRN